MAEPLTPGPDVVARYLKIGEQGFVAFFEEIPADAIRRLAEYLPPADGFRVGSPAGIKRQKAALARNLSRPHPHNRDLKALYPVWRTWISVNFENAKVVHEWIDVVEDAARTSPSQERRSTVEQQVVALLEKLKDESRANHCTREQIERLFEFSPFPETLAGREAITAAKGAEEVRRDAALNELPKRLQKDEDTIESLKSEVKTLSERLGRAMSPTEERVRNIETALAELKASGERDHRATDDATAALRAVNEITKNLAAHRARIDALALTLDSVGGVVRGLETKLKSLDGVAHQIESLASADKDSARRSDELAGLLDILDANIRGAEQDIAAIREHEAAENRIEALAERIDRLEEGVTQRATADATLAITHVGASHKRVAGDGPALGIRWERLGQSGDDLAIGSSADLIRIWSDTLQSLNLKKSGARIFAEECAAAVLVKQVVFLKGAFALPLARRLATSVGGGQGSARISIPVGLEDGERMRRAIEDALGGIGPNIGALVLEGVNRSSLDTMEEVLADCSNGAFGRRIAVFATVNAGFASLPLQVGYSAFGPIFDLDCLDWRSAESAEPASHQAVLPMALGLELSRQIAGAGTDIAEAIRLAGILNARRNPPVERCFARAIEALQFLRTEKPVTALQSLFFGWTVPYWQILGVKPDDMESELDGGKVDGTMVDPRLVALIKARGQP